MLKHTLHIGSASHLCLRNHQLLVRNKETEEEASIPIEDIASIILSDRHTTITTAVLAECITQGVSIVTCDAKYMPIGLHLCLDGHTQHQAIMTAQLHSSEPLKKQIWKNTIKYKVLNQARLIQNIGLESKQLETLSQQVRSGDSSGIEAQAARIYWTLYFGSINAHHAIPDPTYRKRDGFPPNNWLNYGYTILRSMVARALTASGLLPVLGIHHHNKYNAFCLADDIMEPYRPMVDTLVYELSMKHELVTDIPISIKTELLKLPTRDCSIENKTYTLYSAIERTTASLAQSFIEKKSKIIYPNIYVKQNL